MLTPLILIIAGLSLGISTIATIAGLYILHNYAKHFKTKGDTTGLTLTCLCSALVISCYILCITFIATILAILQAI